MNLSEQEKQNLKRAMLAVWDAVGPDVIQMAIEVDGVDYVDRYEVIQTVLDADRLAQHGRLDSDLLAKIKKFNYHDLMSFARNEVFTDGVYVF
jgi:hypothetical protein